jgi:hypothetical protein
MFISSSSATGKSAACLDCLPEGRREVSDPIALSRSDQNKTFLCALCASAVNLISE